MASVCGQAADLLSWRTGFLIEGTAAFSDSGPDYDALKNTFGWMRAVLAVTIRTATQTL